MEGVAELDSKMFKGRLQCWALCNSDPDVIRHWQEKSTTRDPSAAGKMVPHVSSILIPNFVDKGFMFAKRFIEEPAA